MPKPTHYSNQLSGVIMTGSNSNLINFYLGNTVDHRGRKIEDIWQWNDHQLESVHDYIQWLFPLKEKSGFNA
ncbi:MAG: opioid growth factor receptor-related protein, partial [Microcystaceae cyanobacterium]